MYQAAQICLNGHVVNSEKDDHPGEREDYCSKCGSKTVTDCPNCKDPIRGKSRYMHAFEEKYTCPVYCPKCGNAYPWTEAALRAAEDLAAELELPENEINALKATLPTLVSDSPQTTVAASRFRRIITHAAPVAIDGFRTILANVVPEAAQKIMFPTS